ncbi:hypothetical protein TNCV_4938631 [Trichonephila clavipes]|nr:hypothetical protein TNCV_4938631 [Trichonephila clavipes]
MPVFSATSDKEPLRSSPTFRITVLKPSIPYSANSDNSDWMSTDVSELQRQIVVTEVTRALNADPTITLSTHTAVALDRLLPFDALLSHGSPMHYNIVEWWHLYDP